MYCMLLFGCLRLGSACVVAANCCVTVVVALLLAVFVRVVVVFMCFVGCCFVACTDPFVKRVCGVDVVIYSEGSTTACSKPRALDVTKMPNPMTASVVARFRELVVVIVVVVTLVATLAVPGVPVDTSIFDRTHIFDQ